jgi:hypothetical protein
MTQIGGSKENQMTGAKTVARSARRRRRGAALVALALSAAAASGCRESAPDDLIVEEETTEALVFVKSTGGETLNRNWSESNLYKLSPISPDGAVTPITAFAGASVSDPCVSFDGRKILFSMRPPGGQSRNIYEIDAGGSNLRQVTSGGGHDFDPIYLPDGRIMFTSSRDREMDEYNHSQSEHLYTCDADGSNLERVSFNQSDDFDPALLPNGQIVYTRWEHFGTMNRFPLFVTNPDGSGTFHKFGPHSRNFFHAQPTPDGRLIAIESTEIEGDVGPIAVLKLEEGPADPVAGASSKHWDVLTANVNPDGAPWAYGAFKYPFPIGAGRYVASYTLPAADEDEADFALYTFTLSQSGAGTDGDPATLSIVDLTFLYNDPTTNEYDAQLLAPRDKPPVIAPIVNKSVDYGVFLAQDVFNRGTSDGQERPAKGVDPIDKIAVIVGRPTMQGEMGDFSANEFEKRALLGFAPVYADGSFKIKVPADTPISFATLDEHDRGFVVKRTWLYVRPGEQFDRCVGCHEDRHKGDPIITNDNPIAATEEPTDLNITPAAYRVINYEADIAPIVQAKCEGCHQPTYVVRYEKRGADAAAAGASGGDALFMTASVGLSATDRLEHWLAKDLPDSAPAVVIDTIPAPGDLDLTSVPDTTREMNGIFPRAYVNLSGESEMTDHQVVTPAFPRRSLLIDYVLGLGSQASKGAHPIGENALTSEERELFNLWVLLGAQYR